VHLPRPVFLVFAASAAVALALSASPAQAARRHKPQPRPVAQQIRVQGVIVGHSGRTVRLFADTLTVGHATSGHRVVTVTLPAPGKHALAAGLATAGSASLRTGDVLTLAGTGSAAGAALALSSVRQEAEDPAPARAWFGTVSAIDPATGALTLQTQQEADGHQAGDGNGPDGATLTVDVSGAAVTLDGTTSTNEALAVGQTVVVLGENHHDTAVGAHVYAYSTAPTVIAGELHSVTGATITIGDQHTIDLAPGGTPVPLLLNGNPGATTDQLAEGDKILVLATSTTDSITATIAFAFNDHDNGPCGTNED
jgi:hypothetical protein